MNDDTVSRQAAIDALAKAIPALTTPDGSGPYDHDIQIAQEAFVDAMQIINELQAVQPEWIPLSEKFPQEDEDVLLQFPSNQGVGYYEDGDWMINTGDGIYSIIGYNEEKPIAWMPLPESYKGDSSNDSI